MSTGAIPTPAAPATQQVSPLSSPPGSATDRRPGLLSALVQPTIRSQLIATTAARLPISAIPVLLTLHTLGQLGRSYAGAGAVVAATSMGIAFGAPVLGRCLDRFGLRLVVLSTGFVQVVFWSTAWAAPFEVLVVVCFVAGILQPPVFAVGRQAMAAGLPGPLLQAGLSLDAIASQVAYALGPAIAVALVTTQPAGVGFAVEGLAIGLSCGLLWFVNPPIGHTGTAFERTKGRTRPASSERRALALVLSVAGVAAAMALGTEFTMIAAMRSYGEVSKVGLVTAVWCVATIVGGVLYGQWRRQVAPSMLLLLMTVAVVPLVFVDSWWTLMVALTPIGALWSPLMTSIGQRLVDVTPLPRRGEVLGMFSAALTVGAAVGPALMGVVLDRVPASGAFVCIAALGAVSVVLVSGCERGRWRTPTE